MHRREAIYSIFLGGGATATAFSGYTWVRLYRSPDLSYLDNHATMIDDLAEVIIPRTDTPGAKDAGVGAFIICLVKDISDRRAQNNFIEGLKDLQAYTHDAYGKSFSNLGTATQQQVVARLQQKGRRGSGLAGKIKQAVMGKTFFDTLRDATVIGYCTSRVGATRGLAYDVMPFSYTGSMYLTPNQKAWATK